MMIALPLALMVLAGNGLLDHFDPPTGILLTPVVVPLAVWLIAFARHCTPVPKAVLAAALISLHDISIKLYGGAMHDNAGQGIIHLFLFIALLVAFIILVAAVDQDKSAPPRARRMAKVVFLVLVAIHLGLTGDLGLGQCVNCY